MSERDLDRCMKILEDAISSLLQIRLDVEPHELASSQKALFAVVSTIQDAQMHLLRHRENLVSSIKTSEQACGDIGFELRNISLMNEELANRLQEIAQELIVSRRFIHSRSKITPP